jgi:hypothetical protein
MSWRGGCVFRQTGSWRILFDLIGLAMGGGLFTVPVRDPAA